MSNQTSGEKSPLYSFFDFKNQETIQEIEKVLYNYEGVLPEDVNLFLNTSHSRTKGYQLIEAKRMVKEFWGKHGHLTLSDILGLFNLALLDLQQETIKRSDELMKQMSEGNDGQN